MGLVHLSLLLVDAKLEIVAGVLGAGACTSDTGVTQGPTD